MKVGDQVRVVKCDVCPKVVGKTGKIVKLNGSGDAESANVSFGRGRPEKGRPDVFNVNDITVALDMGSEKGESQHDA